MYVYLNCCYHLQSSSSVFIHIYISIFRPCSDYGLYFHPALTPYHSTNFYHVNVFRPPFPLSNSHCESFPPSPAHLKVTFISSNTDYSLYEVSELLADDSQETISCLEVCLPISSCSWVMWDFFSAIETIKLLQFVWFQLTIIAAISTADLGYIWSWHTIQSVLHV